MGLECIKAVEWIQDILEFFMYPGMSQVYLDMGLWTTQDLQYYELTTWDNKRTKEIPWQSQTFMKYNSVTNIKHGWNN